LVEAVHPGTSGNTIEFILSNVTPANPPNMTTLNIAVTVTDTYPGVSLADIADTIGTAVDGGSKPGLIHLVTPPPPPALTQMPDDGQTVAFAAAASTMQATLVGGATDAFTLEAPGDGGGASQFDVAVTNATATTFDLTVTWKKTVTNKTLAEHATAFAYVLNITAPPAGYGVPVEDTYTLHDGHDPTTTPTPATPAEETIPSA
jgi:hypothetical protein